MEVALESAPGWPWVPELAWLAPVSRWAGRVLGWASAHSPRPTASPPLQRKEAAAIVGRCYGPGSLVDADHLDRRELLTPQPFGHAAHKEQAIQRALILHKHEV